MQIREDSDRHAQAILVCVIDDDLSVLRALRRLLVAEHLAVETFMSAEEFLISAHRSTARCLVLDVHLGGLGGLELQEQLAASGTRTPVVFITAYDEAAARERARKAGAVDYLRKPFDDAAILGAIARAITGSGGDWCPPGAAAQSGSP
jgi:FixJ family two-component response regulator